MKQIDVRKNCLLLHDNGTIHYPFSKFLTDRYTNPNTRELVAQALRILYRFCNAHQIELASRSVDGRCLTYDEARKLALLCFRPLPEIEALSDKKVVYITSAKVGKAPQDLPNAVEPNTAAKRLNHISQYLDFYREVFIEPNTRSITLREQVTHEYKKIEHQLKTTITGTKQGHHHNIQSLPSEKFLAIIRAAFLQPEKLYLNKSGKLSRTIFRDRAMTLLACEGLRPGTLGNITRADFRENSCHLVITDNRSKRVTKITTGTPVLKLGASTLVNSASETMIEIWPFTASAIRDYIDTERNTILSQRLINQSNGFLFINETGKPIKHRSSITEMFNRLGERLVKLGLLDVGDDPYFPNVQKYDFYSYVLRHSAATFYCKVKGTDDRTLDSMKSRFGWTMHSKAPQLYAARALSDSGNINLMEFSAGLHAEVKEKMQSQESASGL